MTCQIHELGACPWGVRPVVGMWAKVMIHTPTNHFEVYGSWCVNVDGCARKDYTAAQWKEARAEFITRQATIRLLGE